MSTTDTAGVQAAIDRYRESKRGDVFTAIHHARVTQDRRRGRKSGVTGWVENPYDGLAVLVEEVGEVARALNDQEGDSRLEEELLDVAQVVVAWLESLARQRG